MFKKTHADIERLNPWFKPEVIRVWITTRNFFEFSLEGWRTFETRQRQMPVLAGHHRAARYWCYKNDWYCEDESLDAQGVFALVEARSLKQQRRVQRAMAIVNFQAEPGNEPIPDEVKMFVWKRDNGCCAKCGAQRNLHYDHIIPRCQGGGNSPQNIQLLCDSCNWSKGGSIV